MAGRWLSSGERRATATEHLTFAAEPVPEGAEATGHGGVNLTLYLGSKPSIATTGSVRALNRHLADPVPTCIGMGGYPSGLAAMLRWLNTEAGRADETRAGPAFRRDLVLQAARSGGLRIARFRLFLGGQSHVNESGFRRQGKHRSARPALSSNRPNRSPRRDRTCGRAQRVHGLRWR